MSESDSKEGEEEPKHVEESPQGRYIRVRR